MLFDNLADNAIKACAEGGRVVLKCAENSASVEDNGKGMTEEELLHITEPFYRTDKSRSRAEGGAGLGLALCKNIAEAHGAKLRFESEKGKGTKVFFDFTT
jgi:signal transduction histidine kinase